MSKPLPHHFDPRRLAVQGGTYQGELRLAALPRLGPLLLADGVVSVALSAGVDPEGYHRLEGSTHTTAQLTCQRCLEPVALELEAHFALAVVADLDAAARLPERYEPLLCPGAEAMLSDLVEDELLLALPHVARHTQDCALGSPGTVYPAASSSQNDAPCARLVPTFP